MYERTCVEKDLRLLHVVKVQVKKTQNPAANLTESLAFDRSEAEPEMKTHIFCLHSVAVHRLFSHAISHQL